MLTYKIILLLQKMGHHSIICIIYILIEILHPFYDLMALLIDPLFYLYTIFISFYFIIRLFISIYLLLLILPVLVSLRFIVIISISFFSFCVIIISFLGDSLSIKIIMCHLCVCMGHFELLCLSSLLLCYLLFTNISLRALALSLFSLANITESFATL
jgi:hypothetical protein